MSHEAKKKMLITGISGLLGSNLAYCLKDVYDITGIYHTHPFAMDSIVTDGVDLTVPAQVQDMLARYQPEVIVHCAAQADVDICEERPEEAKTKNVKTTQVLLKCLHGLECRFIFISTDLVYDGTKGQNSETDPVNPLNCYGRTKRCAEEAVAARERSLILRTNFFGWNYINKHSLGEWVIHELSNKKDIKGFTDCYFSGIYTFEFAKILDLAVRKNLTGVYNFASSTSMTKYDFACAIADRLNLDKDLIHPISINDFGFKARRSPNLELDTAKLKNDLNYDIPPITVSVERFIEDYTKGVYRHIKECRAEGVNGPVVAPVIPYGCQFIDEEDVEAVVEVIRSKSLTQGPKIREFEAGLCAITGASLAVAVNSGTSALHIACLTAGVGPGDEVITTPNSFVASANCAVYCGAKPVFADIDPRTYNISPAEISKKINGKTKAVIAVDFAGQSCDMAEIQNVVKAAEQRFGRKIFIIEDACHALGSRYKDTMVGACAYADMAVLSFHPVKHITTGEGGAVLTNDKHLRRKLSYCRSHGITNTADEFYYKEEAFAKDKETGRVDIQNPWYYEQNCLGFNYRITDIQCALGLSQLRKMDMFVKRRREIVDIYNQAFKDVPWLKVPYEAEDCDSNFHLYVLSIDFDAIGVTRARVMRELKARGVLTQVHYIPIYTQPYYQEKFKTQWGDCPNAEMYYKSCLSIPLYPKMTEADVQKVIAEIMRIGTEYASAQKKSRSSTL